MEKKKMIKLAEKIMRQYEKEVRINKGVVNCAAAGYACQIRTIAGNLEKQFGYKLNLMTL